MHQISTTISTLLTDCWLSSRIYFTRTVQQTIYACTHTDHWDASRNVDKRRKTFDCKRSQYLACHSYVTIDILCTNVKTQFTSAIARIIAYTINNTCRRNGVCMTMLTTESSKWKSKTEWHLSRTKLRLPCTRNVALETCLSLTKNIPQQQ